MRTRGLATHLVFSDNILKLIFPERCFRASSFIAGAKKTLPAHRSFSIHLLFRARTSCSCFCRWIIASIRSYRMWLCRTICAVRSYSICFFFGSPAIIKSMQCFCVTSGPLDFSLIVDARSRLSILERALLTRARCMLYVRSYQAYCVSRFAVGNAVGAAAAGILQIQPPKTN